MPKMQDINQAKLAFLYTNIGRGHPAYLDGIIGEFDSVYPEMPYHATDVFIISSGISLTCWKLIRSLYRIGGRGGVVSDLYDAFRRRAGKGIGDSRLIRLLGRDILKYCAGFTGPVIVAHPILARILNGHNRIIYQHGELAVPSEAVVAGCEITLVPLQETADQFIGSGIPLEDIHVTGQCIEPELLASANTAYENRLMRFVSDGPLTAAMFSSGAYPAPHIRKIIIAASTLFKAGYRVVIFAGTKIDQVRRIASRLQKLSIPVSDEPGGKDAVRIIGSRNRHDENRKVAHDFASFDILVATSHERTNWSVGLGLPMFILGPTIGTFSPLNARIALDRGTAMVLKSDADVSRLSAIIGDLRDSGRLAEMARNGYGKTSINGFAEAAWAIHATL